ncbi:MAG: KH domain-containing protein [Myxococcota bacterium]
MDKLLRHLVEPIVANPGDVSIQAIEGDASILLELVVNPDDAGRVRGEEGRTLRALRTVLSAAAGQRKATVDLVEEHGEYDEEE